MLQLFDILFIQQLFCVGVLVSAVIALPTIDKVEEAAVDGSVEYEHSMGYAMAAGGLVCVGFTAIFFDVIMIIVHILYLNSVVKNHFKLYVYLVRK